MSETSRNEYRPKVVTPPGETLLETIEALGLNQSDLATRVGISRKTISEIISGRAPISPDTAIRLESAIGVPAHFWLNGERYYRESLAREVEREMLASRVEWLKHFPLAHAIKHNWIAHHADQVDQLRALLQFFGVASPDEWNELWEAPAVAWRQSQVLSTNLFAISLWLRQGEIQAQAIQTAPFDRSRFQSALSTIRQNLSPDPNIFEPMMVSECRSAGVAVVFVPEIPGTRAYGAVKWITPTKALLQLSLRGKTEDQLWFTFFHEAAHLLQHNKRKTILEFSDGASECPSKDEMEANDFAAELLIPRTSWEVFYLAGNFSQIHVRGFAAQVGVTPGIVVGRLQHVDKQFFRSPLNKLKVHLKFVEQ